MKTITNAQAECFATLLEIEIERLEKVGNKVASEICEDYRKVIAQLRSK